MLFGTFVRIHFHATDEMVFGTSGMVFPDCFPRMPFGVGRCVLHEIRDPQEERHGWIPEELGYFHAGRCRSRRSLVPRRIIRLVLLLFNHLHRYRSP